MRNADPSVITPRTASAPVLTVPMLMERDAKRRRAGRWKLAVGGVVVALAILGAWLALRPKPVPFNERFRLEAVTRGDVIREVRATGHVEAVSTVTVGAEISGRIAAVDVDFNSVVRAGQVLATLDRAALEAQSAQAFASLAAGRATLEQAKVDAAQAKRDLDRATRLAASDASTPAALESAQSAASLALARVSAAEAQVAAQLAAHQLSRINLEHTVIRAPIDGVVITRNIDPGQTVASVLQTPILFELAADLRKMRVITSVDEADVGQVAVGQQASFTVDAYPERVFVGRVTEVRNSPVVVQDVVTYGTVVEVDNLDLLLKPGMTAPVRILTGRTDDVLRVPAAALHFTPPAQAREAASGVWVVERDSLRRVGVTAGITNGELTAITGGDLVEGALVAIELTSAGRRFYAERR